MSDSGTNDMENAQDLGEHRAFVREIHQELATAYGIGGGTVLAVVAGIVAVGWFWWTLTSPLLWLAVITIALVGLLVVRTFVYRRADRLWGRVESYCEANSVEAEALREHYGDDELYQFFDALFDLRERRERMGRGELPSPDEKS